MRKVPAVVVLTLALAGCSSSSKPAAHEAPPSIPATSAATTSAAASDVPSICADFDTSNHDAADVVTKLEAGQSVPQFGIGIPIVGAADGARKLVLQHPADVDITTDLTTFAKSLDDLDAKLVGSDPAGKATATALAAVIVDWQAVKRDCSSAGVHLANSFG